MKSKILAIVLVVLMVAGALVLASCGAACNDNGTCKGEYENCDESKCKFFEEGDSDCEC